MRSWTLAGAMLIVAGCGSSDPLTEAKSEQAAAIGENGSCDFDQQRFAYRGCMAGVAMETANEPAALAAWKREAATYAAECGIAKAQLETGMTAARAARDRIGRGGSGFINELCSSEVAKLLNDNRSLGDIGAPDSVAAPDAGSSSSAADIASANAAIAEADALLAANDRFKAGRAECDSKPTWAETAECARNLVGPDPQ